MRMELEKFKPIKPIINASCCRKVTGFNDVTHRLWLERYVDNLIRSNSYPANLLSSNFYSLLPIYFDNNKVLDILNTIKSHFNQAFSLCSGNDEFGFLPTILEADPNSELNLL